MNSDDANALRFLWLEDVNSDKKNDTNQMLVHIFGWKDSPFWCSKCDATVAECVNRSFYMDDLLKSVETEEEVVSIIKQLIELMQIGGFNLKKFKVTRKK